MTKLVFLPNLKYIWENKKKLFFEKWLSIRLSFIVLFRSFLLVCLLGSKTLETKCIRISMCNVLANHDQNLEFRFRLLKMCLCVKLESSNCRIYWTKFARLNRSKIRLDRSNFVQIVFSAEFPTQPKPKWCVGFYVLLQV